MIAKRLSLNVCHIEADLCSGVLNMLEEINRLVTDRLSDFLFAPNRISPENLRIEGTLKVKIHMVENTVIDTLEKNKSKAEVLTIEENIHKNLILENIFPPIIQKMWNLT